LEEAEQEELESQVELQVVDQVEAILNYLEQVYLQLHQQVVEELVILDQVMVYQEDPVVEQEILEEIQDQELQIKVTLVEQVLEHLALLEFVVEAAALEKLEIQMVKNLVETV
jgi:hypothetical protein